MRFIRPRDYKRKGIISSHRQDLAFAFNWKAALDKHKTFIEALPNIEKSFIYRQIAMLEHKKAKIRQCHQCGRITVVQNKHFGYLHPITMQKIGLTYKCAFCRADYFSQRDNKPKPNWYDNSKERSDKLQEVYKKMYDVYLKTINKGVKIEDNLSVEPAGNKAKSAVKFLKTEPT